MKEMMGVSKIDKKSPAQIELERRHYYKNLIQDTFNEVSAIEIFAKIAIPEDQYRNKIQNSGIMSFEDHAKLHKKDFNEDLLEKYYPGFKKELNNLVEKSKSGEISRDEIISSVRSLHEKILEPVPDLKEIERELLKENKESIAA